MKQLKNQRRLGALLLASTLVITMTGCGTVGSTAADLSLAGAGGVVGYKVSNGKIGGAAAGAAVGYVGSRIAQNEIQKAMNEAEQRGFDRAMNQAVKQQYWIIQNQQRSREVAEPQAKLVPVVIPTSSINGVVQNAHVEYVRTEP